MVGRMVLRGVSGILAPVGADCALTKPAASALISTHNSFAPRRRMIGPAFLGFWLSRDNKEHAMVSVGMDIHSDKTACDFFDPTAEPTKSPPQ